MSLASVDAVTLKNGLDRAFLVTNTGLATIKFGMQNPNIMAPGQLDLFKRDMAKLFASVKSLNDIANPPVSSAPVGSPFFIHRGESAATYETPVKTPSAAYGTGTPSYTPIPYSQGSSKNRKKMNKTLKKTLKRRLRKL